MRLIFWWNSLTRWGWRRIYVKLWGWSATHAGRPGYEQTKPIPSGWRGWGGATRRDRRSGLDDLSAGRTWQGGHWLRTTKPSTVWKRGIRYRRETENSGTKIPERTGWNFRKRKGQGPDQLRGVVAGRRCGQPCRHNMASARLGNHGNIGGWKPLPPTVTSVQHYGDVEVPKRITQALITVKEGGGSEVMAFGGRGGKGGNLKGVQRLWAHPNDVPVLQVPGESVIIGGWWLSGGHTESDECAGGLEEDGKDPEQGGGKAAGIRIFLQSCHTVSVAIWCRYVDGYSPHGTGPRGFPGPGGAETNGADPTVEDIWEVGVHLGGGGDIRGGVWADVDLYSAEAEYNIAVYFYAIAYGPLWGGG